MQKLKILNIFSGSFLFKNRFFIGAFLAFLVGLSVALAYLGARAKNFLEEDARFTAKRWTEYLAQSEPNFYQVFSGKSPLRTYSIYEEQARFFRISSFGLYDLSGSFVPFAFPPAPKFKKAQEVWDAPLVLSNKILSTTETVLVNRSGSELILPISLAGKKIGYLWMKIDQSHLHSNLLEGGIVGILLFVLLLFLTALGIKVCEDMDQRSNHDQIALLATTDRLTGLPNRAAFMAALNDCLAKNMANKAETTVLLIEIDRFMHINDTLGHEGGDYVLKYTAQRLREIAPGAFLGRLGGDTFGLIVSGKKTSGIATTVCQSVLAAMAVPVIWHDHRLAPCSSIGVAISPYAGTVASTLMRHADIARCAAKMEGGNRFHIFSQKMGQQYEDRLALEHTIEFACSTGNFVLEYQPIIDLRTRGIKGFEALVRMLDKSGQTVSPGLFIPAAERMGAISAIGRFVLNRACTFAKTWPAHMTVSVNLSPVQFETGDVVLDIANILEQTGLPPHRLELEVTEGLLLADSKTVREKLHNLQKMGMKIVLDDFGSGYSSLAYLWRFPFNSLKIDRSFVHAMADNQQVRGIIRTIIAMGKILRLPITAEGIETADEDAFLTKMKCDSAQGYFFSRPIPEADVPAFLLRTFRDTKAVSIQKESASKSSEDLPAFSEAPLLKHDPGKT